METNLSLVELKIWQLKIFWFHKFFFPDNFSLLPPLQPSFTNKINISSWKLLLVQPMKSCWETRHSSTTTYSQKRSLVDVGVPARLKDSSRRFKTSAGGPAVANAAKIWRPRSSRTSKEARPWKNGVDLYYTRSLLIPFLVFSLSFAVFWNWIWRKFPSVKIYRRLNSRLMSFSKQTFFIFYIIIKPNHQNVSSGYTVY